jgi:hypothetical protein
MTRYSVDANDPWEDVMQPSDDGDWVQWEDVEPLLQELRRLRSFVENVDQALNTGDGSYRP